MSVRKVLVRFGVVALVLGMPFFVLHLVAAPDGVQISPVQRGMAVLANGFGPWGVLLVRLVEFPNAGLRSFSWVLAAGMTFLGAVLCLVPFRIQNRVGQISISVLWGMFMVVWFGVGFTQIADGLL